MRAFAAIGLLGIALASLPAAAAASEAGAAELAAGGAASMNIHPAEGLCDPPSPYF